MYRILKKVITFCVRLAYRIIYHLIPTQKHTVLFIAFHGRGCLDNPLAPWSNLAMMMLVYGQPGAFCGLSLCLGAEGAEDL